MAATTRRAVPAERASQDFATQLHTAVIRFIEATPTDHLEQRLSDLEAWVNRLERDAQRLTADLARIPGTGRRSRVPARSRRSMTPGHRGIRHLPVEREMSRPGG